MELTDLKPAPYNPRKVDDQALAGLARSIGEFGDISGIVWNRRTGHLATGHQRLAALQAEHGDSLSVRGSDAEGWALVVPGGETIPIRIVDWDENRERAANVTANNPHIQGTWDYPGLEELLVDLKATEFGELYSSLRLDELLGNYVGGGLTDPDDVPEPPDKPVTKPGDLWALGDHRLLCGDAGNAVDVDRLLDGAPIHLACCDPPYGVKVEPRSNNAIAAGLSSFGEHGLMHHQSFDAHRAEKRRSASKYHGFDVATGGQSGRATHKKMRPKDRPLVNDHLSDAEFDQRLRAWFQQIGRVLLPGRAFYLWAGWTNLGNYPAALASADLFWHQLLVWVKNAPVLCRKDYMLGYEVCFYGWRSGAAHQWFGPNNARDVWEVAKVPQQKMVHLTQKPTELAVRAIQNSSHPGEHVLDLFGGSGSTLIAAEQTGRRAYLMELDGLYCDVICDRFQRFAGKPAVLERTGESPIPMKAAEESIR